MCIYTQYIIKVFFDKNICQIFVCGGVVSVSYTHLDVYKRQVQAMTELLEMYEHEDYYRQSRRRTDRPESRNISSYGNNNQNNVNNNQFNPSNRNNNYYNNRNSNNNNNNHNNHNGGNDNFQSNRNTY